MGAQVLLGRAWDRLRVWQHRTLDCKHLSAIRKATLPAAPPAETGMKGALSWQGRGVAKGQCAGGQAVAAAQSLGPMGTDGSLLVPEMGSGAGCSCSVSEHTSEVHVASLAPCGSRYGHDHMMSLSHPRRARRTANARLPNRARRVFIRPHFYQAKSAISPCHDRRTGSRRRWRAGDQSRIARIPVERSPV